MVQARWRAIWQYQKLKCTYPMMEQFNFSLSPLEKHFTWAQEDREREGHCNVVGKSEKLETAKIFIKKEMAK